MDIRFVSVFLTLLLLSACGPLQVKREIVPHMVSLNANGETFEIQSIKDDCANKQSPPGSCNKEELIEFHIDKIREELKTNVGSINKETEIILYVHGGLVSNEKGAEEAAKIIEEINKDSPREDEDKNSHILYPIIINWESSMSASYANHLFKIRQGEDEGWVFGLSTSPFYLVGDMGRALTRLPITYFYQALNIFKPVKVYGKDDIARANRNFYAVNSVDHNISLGKDHIGDFSKIIRKSTYIFPGVFKLITTPMLDAVGKSSWDNMLRRTRTLFRTSRDFECKQRGTCMEREPSGGLSQLMRMLRDLKDKHANGYTVTLIGHSMGTIVISEILRQFSEDKDFVYKDIVYMAAASSIRDFETSVVPYLQANKQTKFFNLTLHPYAEQNENFLLDIAPRGSLLVWLDDFATIPATPADKTLGKWNNAIDAWPYIPADLRKRISLKGFGLVKDSKSNITDPQEHGQFNDPKFRFWDRSFW